MCFYKQLAFDVRLNPTFFVQKTPRMLFYCSNKTNALLHEVKASQLKIYGSSILMMMSGDIGETKALLRSELVAHGTGQPFILFHTINEESSA